MEPLPVFDDGVTGQNGATPDRTVPSNVSENKDLGRWDGRDAFVENWAAEAFFPSQVDKVFLSHPQIDKTIRLGQCLFPETGSALAFPPLPRKRPRGEEE